MKNAAIARRALVFIAKWASAGLAFAMVLMWLRPDLRVPNAAQTVLPQTIAAPTTQVATPSADPPQPRSYAEAVSKSSPAVVNIYTARVVAQRTRPAELDRFFGDQWPAVQERVEASLGSGVIIDTQGHIVTNHHVIVDARDIKLQLSDGRIAEQVKVVGVDPETDLAVLRVMIDKLPVMKLGRSDTLRVGDVVLAIGSPYGLSQTVTQGIVSATGRDQLTPADFFASYIQTDAAINLGNSGGALINTDGELIGINAAMLGQSIGIEGINFAIPVNLVRGVVQQIIKHGYVRRGWLGVASKKISAARETELGLPKNVGVELIEVDADSPAARAGLQVGDVLVALDGAYVYSERGAINRVAALAPGKTLRVAARRGTQKISARVVLGERKPL